MWWILTVILLIFIIFLSWKATHIKYDGKIVIETNSEGHTVYALELNIHPEEIRNKNMVIFEVDKSRIAD